MHNKAGLEGFLVCEPGDPSITLEIAYYPEVHEAEPNRYWVYLRGINEAKHKKPFLVRAKDRDWVHRLFTRLSIWLGLGSNTAENKPDNPAEKETNVILEVLVVKNETDEKTKRVTNVVLLNKQEMLVVEPDSDQKKISQLLVLKYADLLNKNPGAFVTWRKWEASGSSL